MAAPYIGLAPDALAPSGWPGVLPKGLTAVQQCKANITDTEATQTREDQRAAKRRRVLAEFSELNREVQALMPPAVIDIVDSDNENDTDKHLSTSGKPSRKGQKPPKSATTRRNKKGLNDDGVVHYPSLPAVNTGAVGAFNPEYGTATGPISEPWASQPLFTIDVNPNKPVLADFHLGAVREAQFLPTPGSTMDQTSPYSYASNGWPPNQQPNYYQYEYPSQYPQAAVVPTHFTNGYQNEPAMPGAWPSQSTTADPPSSYIPLEPFRPTQPVPQSAYIPANPLQAARELARAAIRPPSRTPTRTSTRTSTSAPVAPVKQISQQGPIISDRPVEVPLCPEQAKLVDIVLQGHNVFFTGSAGTGKSTVLKAFTRRLKEAGKCVDIIAPTGIAALSVGGSTFWTYAGWNPSSVKNPLEKLQGMARGEFVRKRLKKTDVLVIDEISMMENWHFERLNAVLKSARGSYKPFGGVQLVCTGDFHQLPPVQPFESCLHCGEVLVRPLSGGTYVCKKHGTFLDQDKWAFRSKAWEECHFLHYELKSIHRQSDESLIKILQKCRLGQPLASAETDLLLKHPCKTGSATRLYATREEVRRVNFREFNKLKTVKYSYSCLDEFYWRNKEKNPHLGSKGRRLEDGSLAALSEHRLESRLELRRGAVVVLLMNLERGSGLVNGSQGIVVGFEKCDPKALPRAKIRKDSPSEALELRGDHAELRESHIHQFAAREFPAAFASDRAKKEGGGPVKPSNEPLPAPSSSSGGSSSNHKGWPVVLFHSGQKRTIYADCVVNSMGASEEPHSLLTRTQIPLAPAWAISIHKSQGLTLDRVVIDLSRAWEQAQVYVALSRARNLEGLKIEGDAASLCGKGGHDEVRAFDREKFGI